MMAGYMSLSSCCPDEGIALCTGQCKGIALSLSKGIVLCHGQQLAMAILNLGTHTTKHCQRGIYSDSRHERQNE